MADVKLGLRNLHRQLLLREIRTVALPALGAGLGGLDWKDVRRLMVKEFGTEPDITAIVCEPRDTR